MNHEPPFLQKYGCKYYLFLLTFIPVVLLIQWQRGIQSALVYIIFYTNVGLLLPKDNNDNKQYNKYHNYHIYHSLPLVVYLITSTIFLVYMWHKYDELIKHASIFQMLILMSQLLSPGIDASHELIHRNQIWLRVVGLLGLIPLQFTTYPVQHLYLHHKKVGTPDDPITAHKNQNIYDYYFKAIYSSYKFNYQYSKRFFALCLTLNFSYIFVLSVVALRNMPNTEEAAYKVLFFICLSYFSIFLMELIEYIEHYGLVYRTNSDSVIKQICSWNTDENLIINWLIFRFQRHSDHHLNAYKIYSTMDLTPNMPQFPFDFMGGMIMATIPKLWYYIANPLVDSVISNLKYSQEHLNRIIIINYAIKAFLIIIGLNGIYNLC